MGCFAAACMTGEAVNELASYLSAYLALANGEGVTVEFWPLVWQQSRFLLCAAILGFTALGVVGFVVLMGVRGFLFTYSVGCFCRVFGWGGLVPGFFLFGLSALVWAPALFVLSVQGLEAATVLLRRTLGESRLPLPYSSGYFVRMGMCLGAIPVCVLLEYMAVPALVGPACVFLL